MELSVINGLGQSEFVNCLGEIFEQTPSIAEQAWQSRPFASVAELHRAMVAVVQGWDRSRQLDLIRAHPDLGSRAQMAEASVQEQAGAGLDSLSPEEFNRFKTLNDTYQRRFGFPFVMAVKGHDKASILAAFAARLANDPAAEADRALQEIFAIAHLRLKDLIPAD